MVLGDSLECRVLGHPAAVVSTSRFEAQLPRPPIWRDPSWVGDGTWSCFSLASRAPCSATRRVASTPCSRTAASRPTATRTPGGSFVTPERAKRSSTPCTGWRRRPGRERRKHRGRSPLGDHPGRGLHRAAARRRSHGVPDLGLRAQGNPQEALRSPSCAAHPRGLPGGLRGETRSCQGGVSGT